MVPILGISMALVVSCGPTNSGEDPIVHEYSTEWSSDETYHWHKCTDAGCEEVKDKAKHTFDGGQVTTEPTGKNKGVKTYTCSVCNYKKTETIQALGNTISFKEGYTLNKVYDGTAVTAPTSENYTTDSDGVVAVSWYQGTTLLEAAPKNAGTYTVKISAPETTKSVAVSTTKEFTIEKKSDLTISIVTLYQKDVIPHIRFTPGVTQKLLEADANKVKIDFDLSGSAVGTYTGETGIKNIALSPATEGDTTYLNYAISPKNITIVVIKWEGLFYNNIGFTESYFNSINRVYDGNTVKDPEATDLKYSSKSTIDVSFLRFTTKWYDLSDPIDPTLLTSAPKDVGDYKVQIVFEDNEYQLSGAIEKEFAITPKVLTKKAFTAVYDGTNYHTFDLTTADGICEVDKDLTWTIVISLNETVDNEGTTIPGEGTGVFPYSSINSTYVLSKDGDNSPNESENYTIADDTVVTVNPNTEYEAKITMNKSIYAIAFPVETTDMATVVLPDFIKTSYHSITRTVDGVTNYYLSSDPDHHEVTTLEKVDADYDFNVRVPAIGYYSGKTFTKAKGFHYYPADSFVAIPSGTVDLVTGKSYCYKFTADASKTKHEFSITKGLSTALGSVKVFNDSGEAVTIAKGNITIATSGTYYLVYTSSMTNTGYTINYTES